MHDISTPPESDDRSPVSRPVVVGASGDLWQRGIDLLWRRPGDQRGRSWREVTTIEGRVRPVALPHVPPPPYTDEVPTVSVTSPPRRSAASTSQEST